jgi:hypothetical protein
VLEGPQPLEATIDNIANEAGEQVPLNTQDGLREVR